MTSAIHSAAAVTDNGATRCAIRTIVSLERGTCCNRAVEHWIAAFCALPPAVHYVPSFEAAVAATAGLDDAALLLPHVHRLCAELTLSESWTMVDEFVLPLQNPPLFLAAGAAERRRDGPTVCACIAPLRHLLERRNGFEDITFADVPSTQEAARRVAAGTCDYGITNEDGVREYGLRAVIELKKMKIWWMPFQRVRVDESSVSWRSHPRLVR
jgi:hypothetical protein